MTLANRTFGVEIECLLSRRVAHEALRNAGIDSAIEDYNHTVRRHWKVTTDASVRGCEIVSPILRGEEGIQEARKVAKALVTAGARINRDCGLHVHVGAADLTGRQLAHVVERYAQFEHQIDEFMPASRRGTRNHYCFSIAHMVEGTSTFRNLLNRTSEVSHNQVVNAIMDRHVKLNVQSYARQGTVEFRHHGGTVNASKIENWIRFCVNFVEESKNRCIRQEPSRRGGATATPSAPAQGRVAWTQMDARASTVRKLNGVLEFLYHSTATHYLSDAELAAVTGYSENSIPVVIGQLRELGYTINRVRNSRMRAGGYYMAPRRAMLLSRGYLVPFGYQVRGINQARPWWRGVTNFDVRRRRIVECMIADPTSGDYVFPQGQAMNLTTSRGVDSPSNAGVTYQINRTSDSWCSGIDPDVVSFYHERAVELAAA
jgi:biotin operon repressor